MPPPSSATLSQSPAQAGSRATSGTRHARSGLPWWREPMMWLVVSGPAIVVVAGILTAYIAIKGQDPVLDRSVPTWQSGQADNPALPAREARNHVVHAPKPEAPKPVAR